MEIDLIQTKPNEYAYLNDINLTVIETNSDALCPPELAIKEIISKESELYVLNKEFETTKKLKKEVKVNIILHEILNVLVYSCSAVLISFISSPFIPTLIYFLLFKSLLLISFGTRIGKCKKFKKLKEQILHDKEEIENHEKQIEELKNEIGYNVTLQMSREEYERRCRIWELERNNKLPNTKKYFNYYNENTLEKYLKMGQKKRR